MTVVTVFFQGMYRSANYVLFVNYDDLECKLKKALAHVKELIYYSGYDCDSLALEPVSHFCDYFLRIF